ncbi:hypothetical protein JOE57_001554 [Microlunatus panaciterrae]|uniref:Uncharacterized protein n=1 Tax=Microlunatus panaciterrae TaxID=400768 RepID=A0ABS2RIZ4_9ACTN|nr:hypothetical protein [Microlunatus panaciterrae]
MIDARSRLRFEDAGRISGRVEDGDGMNLHAQGATRTVTELG